MGQQGKTAGKTARPLEAPEQVRGASSQDDVLRRGKTACTGGRWIAAACWHNCGGRCLNKVLVADGRVVRQKTDDTHPDSPLFPQQRGCPRGRSQRRQVLGEDRLGYPLVRKNWRPGGGDKERRGRDEWVRLSWDEALDIVAGELRRIKQQYGNRSILAWDYASLYYTQKMTGGWGGGNEITQVLSLFGGHTNAWGSTSWGTWLDTGREIGLGSANAINDRLDLQNCQLVVMWGANPAWSSPGSATYHYLQAKRAGSRFIFIDPFFTDSAQVLADEWIPVRPGTDHALALALAHTLIVEDNPVTNPLIDWDFLNRCTIGFDASQLPGGADYRNNFRDYILGTFDGHPKTPEWAASICGVEPERIRGLAREIATTARVALITSFAPARINNADSWPQAFMALGCMTGHIGQAGRMTGVSSHRNAANSGPALVMAGDDGVEFAANPLAYSTINQNELWDAVLTGRYTGGRGESKEIDIRMIYHSCHSYLNQKAGVVKAIAAHRKVEFVVAQNYVLNPSAQYADIVLPVTTMWERGSMLFNGNRETLLCTDQVIKPYGEARDDIWIAKELAGRLGIDDARLEPVPPAQAWFNQLAGARVIRADGAGYEPLLTISGADIAAMGADGEPQTGRITLQELREKGIYQVPRAAGDKFSYIHLKEFREDPIAHPLTTPSGRLEIHCQAVADLVSKCGWTQIDPIPTYQAPCEGYEDTFSDWAEKAKGEYPLQLYSIHVLARAHSCMDNVAWLREAFAHDLLMNPDDAESRGIANGESVLVRSRHGT
ncbi:MAG: molybdopterin-dependent oxidoreductase, partial [Negativicutes bacterium]|nr:molybdopterin-dependent oxidoreductase [Negativicutes bacterium]